MTRLYLFFVLLVCGIFSVFGTQDANACAVDNDTPQSGIVRPAYYTKFYGAQAKAQAYIYTLCDTYDTYLTDIDGYPTDVLTARTSDSYNAYASYDKVYNAGTPSEYTVYLKARADSSASIPTATVSAFVSMYGQNMGPMYTSKPHFIDLLLIELPTAQSTDVNYIPLTFCSEYSSGYSTMASSVSTFTYEDFIYDGEHNIYDGIVWDSGSTWRVTHTATGRVCNYGDVQMTGKYVYFSLSLTTQTLGNIGYEPLQIPGRIINIGVRDGAIKANIDLGNLPSGATCYSASGTFPGCERKLPNPNMCMADATGGNPVNFALAAKAQNESDYSGGILSFSRFYRSDARNESGVMGENWRHNFDRNAHIIVTDESTTADVSNVDGSMIVFRKDPDTEEWETTEVTHTDTFEEIIESSVLVGYLRTTPGDTREYYDTDGLLTRIEYNGGEALDFEYDANDRLDTVTNEQGNTIEFSYNGNDQVSSVVTPGGTYSYTYDASDNLSTVTRPDSEVRTYHYEDANFVNALTGITNEKSIRIATWAYDSEGRPVSSEHVGGVESFDIDYNSDGTVTTTNALGKETVYKFQNYNGIDLVTDVEGQASANCAAANKSNKYDARGFLTEKTDWNGNITEYERNDDGLETSRTEDVDGDAERTVTTTYINGYSLPDVITETGKTTDYDYDSDGRLTSMAITDTGTSETRTTTYSYYANGTDGNGNTVLGKLYQVNGPRTDVTDVTTYTYDANKRLVTTTNALGHVTETTSFDSANRPLTIEDANDVETTFVYDTLGRLTSSTVASGTALAATTGYTYDDNGNVLTITLPNGVVTTNTYDNADRLTGVEDDIGNTITYTLDDAGNITQEVYRDPSETLKFTLSKVYDELSRLIESVDANSDTEEYDYDDNGNRTQVTDGNENATAFAFDGLNRLVEQTDALSGVTSHDLNDLDQNEGTTDPRSNETTYTYNAFGDIVQEVSPDRGTISYTHDPAGNITSMTDARSVVTNYTYDAINRLTDIEYPSDGTLDVELTYDSATGCGTSLGRLCAVEDAAGTTEYIYDDLGRLTQVTETRGALEFTTEYEYDLSGILTGITLPSGREITYTLNDNGQVSGVSAEVNSTGTTLASSVAYLPFGPMSGMTYGNSITLSNTYNTAYQLTNRTIGALMNASYTYDDARYITAAGADSYTLDDLYRITAENADSYTYDAIGNRLTKNTDDYTYPATSSKLSDVEGDGVSYDTAGNITDDDTREFTINAAGQVEEIEISSVTVGEYVYDANNLRVKKTADSVVTHYVYGLGGLLYGEYDSSGDLVREYVYLNGEPIAQIDNVSSSDVLTYLHTDHLGTPRYGTNAAATQVWAWDSDVFGNGAPSGSVTVNLRFPGQYYDSESALHYNWNRYYNPATGRYISSDPIGLSGGLNTYLYSMANPVAYIDPEGLVTLKEAHDDLMTRSFLILSPKKLFENWYRMELEVMKETNWTKALPKCPKKLCFDSAGNPKNPNTFDSSGKLEWNDPHANKNTEHPKGVWEMRSKPVGIHASQCIYYADGRLAEDSPNAGTADYVSMDISVMGHMAHDWEPWKLAQWLGKRAKEMYYNVRPKK